MYWPMAGSRLIGRFSGIDGIVTSNITLPRVPGVPPGFWFSDLNAT